MNSLKNAQHPDSKLQVENAPIILPKFHSEDLSTEVHSSHSYINTAVTTTASASHISTDNSNNQLPLEDQLRLESVHDSNSGSTTKPTGGFRLRLYWQNGYNWQDSSKERFWCMQCRGGCQNGDAIRECYLTRSCSGFLVWTRCLLLLFTCTLFPLLIHTPHQKLSHATRPPAKNSSPSKRRSAPLATPTSASPRLASQEPVTPSGYAIATEGLIKTFSNCVLVVSLNCSRREIGDDV